MGTWWFQASFKREKFERFSLFLQNLKGVVNIFSSPQDIDPEMVYILEGRFTDAYNTLTFLIDSLSDFITAYIYQMLQPSIELRELIEELSLLCRRLNDAHLSSIQDREGGTGSGPVSFSAPTLNPPVSVKGRPRREITKDQLEHLRTLHFSWRKIAQLLCVSRKAIQRRLAKLELNEDSEKYSSVSDEELDSFYKYIVSVSQKGGFLTPSLGRRRFIGALRSLDLRVQCWRVSECIRRCDPVGSALRWRSVIRRRKYYVPAPNSLWHIDSCHKLIRYRIIIHICIDGKTRLFVYCSCHDNNEAETVLS